MRGSPWRARYAGEAQHTRRVDAHAAPHEVLPADGADAHRRVEALVDEIDDAVGQLDVESERPGTSP